MPYGGVSVKELRAALGCSLSYTSTRWQRCLKTLTTAWLADPRKTLNEIIDTLQRTTGATLDGFHLPVRRPLWTADELCDLLEIKEPHNMRQAWNAALRAFAQVYRLDSVRALSALVEYAMEVEGPMLRLQINRSRVHPTRTRR